MIPEDAVLCYAEWEDSSSLSDKPPDGVAYFTTQKLSDQWGDDWNDAPYESNAGWPYEPCWHNVHPKGGKLCTCGACKRDWNEDGTPKWAIYKVRWGGRYALPKDGHFNSPYSVQGINEGEVAWLRWEGPRIALEELAIGDPDIYAGTSWEEFRRKVLAYGGTVKVVEAAGEGALSLAAEESGAVSLVDGAAGAVTVITVECSAEAADRLKQRFESGEMKELAGVKVLGVSRTK